MANSYDDEPPLDPTLLRVQAKLRRLMMIGGLTLGLGIAAVLLAVVYRITQSDSSSDPADAVIATLAPAEAGLSPEAELVSVALDGNAAALAFRDGGATVLITVDTRNMVITGRLTVGP